MIIRNCLIYYARLDPKRPNVRFDPENPTWELQIRTYDRDQATEWEEKKLLVKPVIPKDGDPYFRVNLKRNAFRKDNGEPSTPVEVFDGNLKPLDPRTIGYGSVGNIRVTQYEYRRKDGSVGVVSVLVEVQITKLIKYVPKNYDDEEFEREEMEIIEPEDSDNGFEEEGFEVEEKEESEEKTDSPKIKTPPTPSVAPDEAFD